MTGIAQCGLTDVRKVVFFPRESVTKTVIRSLPGCRRLATAASCRVAVRVP
ncbi:MAG TPA: hypothetical protein VJU80_00410 [Solirubrobacteraceae bacterium]|nr:hypothetical protein [Solirubrobacteraceae bacterium]